MTVVNGIPSKADFQIEIGQYYPKLSYFPNLGIIRKRDPAMKKIYSALDQVQAHRASPNSPDTMAKLRALRKACADWLAWHYMYLEELTETSSVKQLGRAAHYRMEYIVTMNFQNTAAQTQQRARIAAGQTRNNDMTLTGNGTTIGRTVGSSYFTESYGDNHLSNVPGYMDHRQRYPGRHMAIKDYIEQIHQEYQQDDPNNSLGLSLGQLPQNGVRYCTYAERQVYKLDIRGDGLLRKNDGTLLDTSGMHSNTSGNGWGIFVMDMAQNFYVNAHAVGRFHHSSFLAGDPVYSAGEMCASNGILVGLTNKTGHYRSGPDELYRALTFLEATRVGPVAGGGIGGRMKYVAVSDPFRAKDCWRSGADAIISDCDFSNPILRGDPEVKKPTQQDMAGIADRIRMTAQMRDTLTGNGANIGGPVLFD